MNKRLGSRITIMIGGLISSAGFVLTYFATSFEFLFFSFGVTVGVGMGICLVPCTVIIGSYFRKYRNIAFGLTSSAVGIGGMVLPPIVIKSIEAYGWRGCMLIMAGISLQLVLSGDLARPQDLGFESDEDHIEIKEVTTIEDNVPGTESCINYKESDEAVMVQCHIDNCKQVENHNNVRLLNFTIQDLSKSNEPMTVSTASLALSFTENKHVSRFRRRIEIPIFNSLDAINVHTHTKSDVRMYSKSHEHLASDHKKAMNGNVQYKESISETKILPEMKCSVTDPLPGTKCSVLRNGTLVLLFINLLCTNGAQFIVYLHFPAYFRLQGAEESELSHLLILMGVTNIICRLMMGAASNDKNIGALLLYFSTGGVTAMFYLLCPLLSQTFAGRIVFALGFGFYSNTYAVLNPPLAVELSSLAELNTAFSINAMMMGVSSLVSPPLAGWLYDISQDYKLSFYYAGVQQLIGSLLLMLVPFIQK